VLDLADNGLVFYVAAMHHIPLRRCISLSIWRPRRSRRQSDWASNTTLDAGADFLCGKSRQ